MTKHSKAWWGRRFIEALESFHDPARLARGRQYLGSQRIAQWRAQGSRVEARIRGRISPYYGAYEEPVYDTSLEFLPIPDAAWREAVRHIGGKAGFVCRLLFNEMPDEIEQPLAELGLSLLPQGKRDFQARCSCQETEQPCTHVAGLCYLLAAKLDQDPFLLLELRGLPHPELARQLQATPLGAALAPALCEEFKPPVPSQSFFHRPEELAAPETVSPRDFWRGAKRLPPGVEPPQPAAVPGILVRKGGDYPPFWDKDESFVEVMDAFYEQARKQAKEWM
jgi:uncharacterized Zn finger protein